MGEAFKTLINAKTVAHAGEHLERAWPAFERQHFERLATHELEALEFKARALQFADALEATLPASFAHAATVIEQALAPPLPMDPAGEPVGLSGSLSVQGLSGWVLWGAGEYVARCGRDEVPRALECLRAITQRFTGEFAIRPFIIEQPALVLETLQQWTDDPSPHVRRLASEGSRPRLPWGLRLQALVADPSPCWPLLQALQDDPSAYVRRSVANHLNDIAKDHPDQVAAWVARHLTDAGTKRQALLRHASRSLIKQGHAPTLAAWGLKAGLVGQASLALAPEQVRVGESIALKVTLQSDATSAQTLVVDYAVHHQRANGSSSPKVFKGWKLSLAAGEQRALEKRHSLKPVTTRRLYPGVHELDVRVNGQVIASSRFDLIA